jgi:hypothetical protein
LRRLVQERRKMERYTPLDLCSNFVFSITYDDPRDFREAMDSEDEKL